MNKNIYKKDWLFALQNSKLTYNPGEEKKVLEHFVLC